MKGDAARLALGTVQFGLDYGITNQAGKTPPDEVARILAISRAAGIDTLDTAALYGDAEAALGVAGAADDFRIVSKTGHFTNKAEMRATVMRSLDRIRTDALYGLLVHRASDLIDASSRDVVWELLSELKASGRVQKVGVSVYDRAELDAIRERYDIDLVQLPCSVFDQSLVSTIADLRGADVEVHVRSLYLQGLVFVPPSQLHNYFEPVRDNVAAWHTAISEAGTGPLRAALGFGLSLGADRLVIGVENDAQLREAIEAVREPVMLDWAQFDFEDERYAAPKNWVLG